jgi:hypothetical protein
MSIGGFNRFRTSFLPDWLGTFLLNLKIIPKSYINGHGKGVAIFGFYTDVNLVCLQDYVGFVDNYFSRHDGIDYFFKAQDLIPIISKLKDDNFVEFKANGFLAEYSSYSDHESSWQGDYRDIQRMFVNKGLIEGYFKFVDDNNLKYELKIAKSECYDSWRSDSESSINWDVMYDFIKKNL